MFLCGALAAGACLGLTQYSYNEELAAKVYAMEQNVEANESAISTLNQSVRTLTADNNALKAEKANYLIEIADLSSEITAKDTTISSLNSSIHAKDLMIANLDSEVDSLNDAIDSLNGQVSEKDTTISSLSTSIQNKNATINELGSQVNSLNNQVEELNNQIDSLNSEITEKDNIINELSNSSITLNRDFYSFNYVWYDPDDGTCYGYVSDSDLVLEYCSSQTLLDYYETNISKMLEAFDNINSGSYYIGSNYRVEHRAVYSVSLPSWTYAETIWKSYETRYFTQDTEFYVVAMVDDVQYTIDSLGEFLTNNPNAVFRALLNYTYEINPENTSFITDFTFCVSLTNIH